MYRRRRERSKQGRHHHRDDIPRRRWLERVTPTGKSIAFLKAKPLSHDKKHNFTARFPRLHFLLNHHASQANLEDSLDAVAKTTRKDEEGSGSQDSDQRRGEVETSL